MPACAVISSSGNVVAVIEADPFDVSPFEGCTLIEVPDDGSIWTGFNYDQTRRVFVDPNPAAQAVPPVKTGEQF